MGYQPWSNHMQLRHCNNTVTTLKDIRGLVGDLKVGTEACIAPSLQMDSILVTKQYARYNMPSVLWTLISPERGRHIAMHLSLAFSAVRMLASLPSFRWLTFPPAYKYILQSSSRVEVTI